jgi:hypothetical protein
MSNKQLLVEYLSNRRPGEEIVFSEIRSVLDWSDSAIVAMMEDMGLGKQFFINRLTVLHFVGVQRPFSKRCRRRWTTKKTANRVLWQRQNLQQTQNLSALFFKAKPSALQRSKTHACITVWSRLWWSGKTAARLGWAFMI